jgi:hypothetical protein
MTSADDYRAKATAFMARSRLEPDAFRRSDFERLAFSYLRLAEEADRNSKTDIVYETPPLEPDQPVQQQQQQQQPKTKPKE